MDFTNELENAADARALEILGEDQYNDPDLESAKDGITEDFKAGVEWLQEFQEEKKTEINMNLISAFIDHVKTETGEIIADSTVLSFFNA